MWKWKKQKKHDRRERRRGAILLEALLAVVILSVAVTVVIQSMMSSLRASVVAADYLQAASLLNRFVVDYIVTSSAPRAEQRLPPPLDRYRLVAQVKDSNHEFKKLRLRDVQVSLSWPVNRNQRELTACTLIPGEANP